MNDFNGYKLAQIGGVVLAVVMVFLLTVVGWYRTSTEITWIILMLVGVGIFYGARKTRRGRPRPQTRRAIPQA